MPHYRCCVGGCDNDSRYPEKKILKREHATGDLTLYYFSKDSKGEKDWSIVRTVSLG